MKVLTNRMIGSFGGIERVVDDLLDNSHLDIKFDFLSRSPSQYTITSWFKGGEVFFINNDFKNLWYENVPKGDFTFVDKFMGPILKHFSSNKPDIGLVNATNDLAYILARVCNELGVPYVAALHGYHFVEKNIPNVISEETIFKGAKHVIFVSDFARKFGIQTFGAEMFPSSEVIYNGLNPNFLAENDTRKDGSISWVGRDSPVKNIDLLFEIANGSNDKFKIITSPAKQIPGNVTIFPSANAPSKLSEFYQQRSLILSTSTFETYGNVPLEAIVSGTPALVPLTMGISEVFLEYGLDDLVVSELNSKNFLELIPDAKRKYIPVNLRREISDRFSPENFAKKYFEVLREHSGIDYRRSSFKKASLS